MNNRQQLFCEEYLKDLNATKAAIRAGYSEKTAYSQGQRLLKNVEIKNRLQEIREKIQDENIATIKDIEEFLSLSLNGEMEEEVISVVAEIEGSSKVVKTKKQISLRDRIKAAELLGKRYGLWTEKQEVDINLPTFIDDIQGAD
ncbi:terminase small subunit [Finegoldia magna]|jgi:phage terminase small subunit|uniref:Terminase small subunit n=2 Tax=root TaxID=1 RepID=A0A2N6SUJ5_FINMA|nr:terminase small subunit [Finegoldia magna]PMC60706.1 terminase small subunit [Finegoldia magna]DAD99113.1 MAG TPA: Terminase small subunit [Siphoviridae sp. ctFKD2]